MLYEPFITDPEHVRRLDGQRFVVLRPATAVTSAISRCKMFFGSAFLDFRRRTRPVHM
jgi:hypothetical protein